MNLLKAANPMNLVSGAVGLAGSALGIAETSARTAAGVVRSLLPGSSAETQLSAEATSPVETAAPVQPAATPHEPQIVLAEPAPPAEPPIPVVERALAAEAAAANPVGLGSGGGHEPRGATREEEHGEEPLARAEAEEIALEAEAADPR